MAPKKWGYNENIAKYEQNVNVNGILLNTFLSVNRQNDMEHETFVHHFEERPWISIAKLVYWKVRVWIELA